MTTKEDILTKHVMKSIDQLRRMVEIDAPGVIIGAQAWSLFTTVLACYGAIAGSTMIGELRDRQLQSRGICTNEDCGNAIERAPVDFCAACCLHWDIGADAEFLDGCPPLSDQEARRLTAQMQPDDDPARLRDDDDCGGVE